MIYLSHLVQLINHNWHNRADTLLYLLGDVMYCLFVIKLELKLVLHLLDGFVRLKSNIRDVGINHK